VDYYFVRIFINHAGGVEQVGLYNAGFAIINTYVGFIFTAMSTDYYPRLSLVANDEFKCKQTINQQAEVAILILAPILIGFLIFINWVIILLYSEQFISIKEMLYWASLGMFFKAASWSIGFIFLAKGEGNIFFWSELIANTYILLFNIVGYHLLGLTGLGISFTIAYIIILLQVFIISKYKYRFSFNKTFVKIFIVQLSLAIITFLIITLIKERNSYFIGLFIILISCWFSLTELNKLLDLKSLVLEIKNRIYGRK